MNDGRLQVRVRVVAPRAGGELSTELFSGLLEERGGRCAVT